jgi:serine/threonine protein kinase/predicted ATPase/Tfp pilus assembly protein PilF
MAAPTPPPQRIGRYELVSLLGRGGAGQVWEAVLLGPRGFRKPVALKVVHAGLDMKSPQGQSLVKEARLGALLSHPNVVGIYELGEGESKQLYVAMELVKGPSVLSLVREGPLSPSAILDVGMQACAGLQHIHTLEVDGARAGLVHRDVKPSNLLVDGSGLVKVADLGVARLTGQAEELIAGTPGYMPPEQLEGDEDARTDLFALGVTLYVLAAGVRPFGGGTPALRRVMQVEGLLAEPAFLAPADQRVPGLGEVLRRCFRFDPAKRWSSAAELGEALRQLRTQHPGMGVRQRLLGDPPSLTHDVPDLGTQDETTDVTDERARQGLPRPSADFHGRAEELAALDDALKRSHVVVLSGPAGSGKSRLALEQGRRMERRGAQVWWVDLADLSRPADLYRAIATALDVPLSAGDPTARLGRALRALGRATLILDNAEGLAETVASAITSWRGTSRNLRFLVATRRSVRVRGAVEVPLEGLASDAGLALFLARAAHPPPVDEHDRVRELVRRVDGLPLAIELAAARTRLASLDQILRRLDLRLLSGGPDDRRRSLRASLDASYDRLSAPEQAALGQLGVFVDGFVLEAAEAVLDVGASPESPWALDVLDRLLDHSLVQLDSTTGRFRMLHTVRAYGLHRLGQPERLAAERRHGAYYAQMGSVEAVAALHQHGGEERLARMSQEVENLSAAIERAIGRGDARVAQGAALALWEVMQLRGPMHEALGTLMQVVEAAGDAALPRLLSAAGRAATMAGSASEARRLLTDAMQLARRHGDVATEAEAHGNLGYLQRDAGDVDGAQSHFEASLAGYKIAGDRWGQGRALYRLGLLRYHQSRMTEARGLYEASLRAFREVGDRRHEAGVLTSYALALADLGRASEAIQRGERGLAMHRELGNRHTEAVALTNLGILYRRTGRIREAKECYEAALVTNRSIGNRRLEGATWGNVGTLLADQGDLDGACRAFEQALAAHREVGNRHYEGVVLGNYADVLLQKGDLVGARQRLGFALGVAVSVGDRAMEGAFLGVMGEVLEAQGDVGGAEASLSQAEAILEAVGDKAEQARVVLRRVEVYRARGQWKEARKALARARVLCEQLPEASGVWRRFRALRAKL